MDIAQLACLVQEQATKWAGNKEHDLTGYLPDSRKCVIQHDGTLADMGYTDVWQCWIYSGQNIRADVQWMCESLFDLAEVGQKYHQVNLLDIVVSK